MREDIKINNGIVKLYIPVDSRDAFKAWVKDCWKNETTAGRELLRLIAIADDKCKINLSTTTQQIVASPKQ